MDCHGTLSIDMLFATLMFLIIIGLTSTLILDRFYTADDTKELAESQKSS